MKPAHAIAAAELGQRFTRHIQAEGAKVARVRVAGMSMEQQMRAVLGHIAGLEAIARDARELLAAMDGEPKGGA